ncbi:MAG: D-glycerate dehydrogenase, partial [Gemmatimonadota bacterium]|nr:D-glycerate dehydrogenase [Gemmatimonadota bacterium]
MSARPRLLVTRRLPARVESALGERFDVVQDADDRPLTGVELRDGLRDCDAVLCTVTDRLDAACFATGPLRARILANFGVGVNHIALEAAARAGIVVTNTPDVLTDDTADLAILLMLAVLRRAGEGERELRAGAWTGWRPTHLLGRRLTGRTLGVVGYGRIGAAVAARAHAAFRMPVVAWTRTPPDGGAGVAPAGVTFVATLDALLAAADVVSLHVPA